MAKVDTVRFADIHCGRIHQSLFLVLLLAIRYVSSSSIEDLAGVAYQCPNFAQTCVCPFPRKHLLNPSLLDPELASKSLNFA